MLLEDLLQYSILVLELGEVGRHWSITTDQIT